MAQQNSLIEYVTFSLIFLHLPNEYVTKITSFFPRQERVVFYIPSEQGQN